MRPMNKKPLTDQDGEVRELNEEDVRMFRPIAEAEPELLHKIKRGVGQRGPQKAPRKVPISIRVSKEVADYFRESGAGWQTRIDDILKDYVSKQKS